MPTVERITARWLDGLNAEGVRADWFETATPGFGVRVAPGGRKTFFVMYRHAGRLRRLTLGPYGPLSLADARQMANRARRDVHLGGDPAREKLEQRRAETFAELAEEYLERHAKPNKRSWREDQRIITNKLRPAFGNVRVQDVSRADVRALVEKIAEGGAPIEANRTLACVRKVFSWAVSRDLVDHNPASGIPRPGKEQQRDRVLSEDEIRRFWEAAEAEGSPVARIFQLELATAQRSGEVKRMRWQDIDLVSGWWTIPAEHSKNALAHRVPLSAVAAEVLQDLEDGRGRSEWVFPSPRPGSHVEEVQKGFQRIRDVAGIEDFRGHDLRRTAASLMTGMGISRLVVGKILNHVESGITKVYDRHSYDAEKRHALEAWGRKLQAIIAGEAMQADVVQFQRA